MSLIRQIGYVVIATPDPNKSAQDISSIVGLRVAVSKHNGIHLSSNSRVCEVAYVRNSERGIRSVGLETSDVRAVDEIHRRVRSEGLEILDDRPSIDEVERAIRFIAPGGPILEVHTPVARQNTGPQLLSSGRHVKRLDHVNLRTGDPRAFHDFMTKTIEMKLSDRTTNFERAWYRAADGFHHTIAAAPGSGLHHYGFDAFRVDDLVAVADNLTKKDRTLLWGIGRHGPGNNVFSYYHDPDDCVVEVSFGMDRIDDDAYEAGNWPFEEGNKLLDLWGSHPPPRYFQSLTPFIA